MSFDGAALVADQLAGIVAGDPRHVRQGEEFVSGEAEQEQGMV